MSFPEDSHQHRKQAGVQGGDGEKREAELAGDYTTRLATFEQLKMMPYGQVWDCYCLRRGVPTEAAWLGDVKTYENDVLASR